MQGESIWAPHNRYTLPTRLTAASPLTWQQCMTLTRLRYCTRPVHAAHGPACKGLAPHRS